MKYKFPSRFSYSVQLSEKIKNYTDLRRFFQNVLSIYSGENYKHRHNHNLKTNTVNNVSREELSRLVIQTTSKTMASFQPSRKVPGSPEIQARI